MRNNIKTKFLAFAFCFFSVAAVAQTLHSSYFLSRMPMRNKLNPALMNDYGYVSFPILGNFSVTYNSNVGISNFLFPSQTANQLNTFMHQDVRATKFLDGLKSNNNMGVDLDMSLISFGFFSWGGYNTFDLSLRSYGSFNMPYDLFAFLKNGQDKVAGSTYHLQNLKAEATAYVELGLGHARPITDKLTAGAKFRFLFGGGHGRMNIDRMDITLSQDEWLIRSHGELSVSTPLLTNPARENEELKFDEFENGSFGLAGFGVGIDLGATYKLLDNLTLSMALTDIGFISWSGKGVRGETESDEFSFKGFENIATDEDAPNYDDNSFDAQFDRLGDQLGELAKFKRMKPSSEVRSLRTTLNVAGEYGILNNKISFGLLSSTRFGAPKVLTELMASANFRPATWFNAAVNGSVSNMGGFSYGLLLNLCPRGFNFFIGTDYMIGRVNPQFIPIKGSSLNFNFGINFPLGRNPFLADNNTPQKRFERNEIPVPRPKADDGITEE